MNRLLVVVALGAGAALLVAGPAVRPSLNSGYVGAEMQSAATFFVESISAEQLRTAYANVVLGRRSSPQSSRASASGQQIKILIVPGHEPGYGGAEFGGVRERDVAVDIAQALAVYLRRNPRFDVLVARDKVAWDPTLQAYFDTHLGEIEAFATSQADQMRRLLVGGAIAPQQVAVEHNTAPSSAAFHLYGINKWTSENNYDITLHLHLNDYAGRRGDEPGQYNGFAVYVPNHQYSNAAASRLVGEAVAARLAAYHATSSLPTEGGGIMEDQQLIAIGSNNTVNDASILLEYGYIYEPQFTDPQVLPLAEQDYAYATYLGLQDFFEDTPRAAGDSVAFPFDWRRVLGTPGEVGQGVYALQALLHHLGFYPPAGKSFTECPVSGTIGPCTGAAIAAYQNARNLDTSGVLDAATQQSLSAEK